MSGNPGKPIPKCFPFALHAHQVIIPVARVIHIWAPQITVAIQNAVIFPDSDNLVVAQTSGKDARTSNTS